MARKVAYRCREFPPPFFYFWALVDRGLVLSIRDLNFSILPAKNV